MHLCHVLCVPLSIPQGIRINCVAPGLMLSPQATEAQPAGPAGAEGMPARDMIGIQREELRRKTVDIYRKQRLLIIMRIYYAQQWHVCRSCWLCTWRGSFSAASGGNVNDGSLASSRAS